ncbi:PEP-dependent dihydroxyacetone kinase, phosphoryl donor subunit DhaM [Austwickia sp. TVS 96-490-7B]|uniref:dihydroxyacetone kinase phosphoryl donor subunit DhaM n=1 Tax=Austwickia sp. TVS 96-490-7B TaxID=2830843 RepID=UPI001C560ECF|nr:dihydroxyacetone kinase phosphoryl donor subunit DhaM [Austwickia sp. TVS 96-490-7B]MBW3084234.1 PEP-dependent dihydroxyacetone kinase, phosphoryl donor subunit DhaM [Austwickia sp. TVS 96-490-7B]
MIGIVVVSHSRPLARAAVALAAQMVPTDGAPAIAVAAGVDEDTLGTDATAVAEAIAHVDSPDGVLVFVDLGSALLSTEMALEMIEPDLAARTVVTPAPLVEGLFAAVITASTGAPMDVVRREAENALSMKTGHLAAGN